MPNTFGEVNYSRLNRLRQSVGDIIDRQFQVDQALQQARIKQSLQNKELQDEQQLNTLVDQTGKNLEGMKTPEEQNRELLRFRVGASKYGNRGLQTAKIFDDFVKPTPQQKLIQVERDGKYFNVPETAGEIPGTPTNIYNQQNGLVPVMIDGQLTYVPKREIPAGAQPIPLIQQGNSIEASDKRQDKSLEQQRRDKDQQAEKDDIATIKEHLSKIDALKKEKSEYEIGFLSDSKASAEEKASAQKRVDEINQQLSERDNTIKGIQGKHPNWKQPGGSGQTKTESGRKGISVEDYRKMYSGNESVKNASKQEIIDLLKKENNWNGK